MAKKKTSKTEKVTPSEMVAFAESLNEVRSAARKKYKKKVSGRAARPGRTADPRQMSLPGVDEELFRTMPNHLARSSLFAPVARGRKRLRAGELLVSRGDAEIVFWGEQLDEAQADVWMQAVFEAAKVPLGSAVKISRGEFLRAIGRNTGRTDYQWLLKAMVRLSWAMMIISEVKNCEKLRTLGDAEPLRMLNHFKYDATEESYTLEIDPRWVLLYAGSKYSKIDWVKRLAFGNQQDMAKSLQRLIATSDDKKQRYSLDWLKDRMCFSGRIRDFRKSLSSAFRELERLEIIVDGEIGKSSRGAEQASWTRL